MLSAKDIKSALKTAENAEKALSLEPGLEGCFLEFDVPEILRGLARAVRDMAQDLEYLSNPNVRIWLNAYCVHLAVEATQYDHGEETGWCTSRLKAVTDWLREGNSLAQGEGIFAEQKRTNENRAKPAVD